jgi:multidrug efflux system membrane fusion protein
MRVLAVGCLILLLAACSRNGGEEPRAQPPRPVPVTVAAVEARAVPLQVTAIGTVQALATVSVKPQVSGQLARVFFTEGQDVNAGDRLVEIDPRPFQAALGQAEAAMAKDQALLESAQKDEARYRELVQRDLIARQQFDQAHANAAALAATVKADRAVVDNARLQVGYTLIRAPIRGRTGAALVREGNVVTANQTELVVINQLTPITAVFSVPEIQLTDIRAYRQRGTLKVEATIRGQAEGVVGELSFIDNRVDPATGTVQLKATFPNTDTRLWPGQFVNVVMTLAVEPHALVVPREAVQSGPQGRHVFVVRADGTVEPRPVTVVRESGPSIVIGEGVRPGEQIVTEGQARLVAGTRVEIKTAGGPAASPAASPATSPPARR